MPKPLSYLLTTDAGAPHTTATPSFVTYVDRQGNARGAPSVSHLGGGRYVFTPSSSDEAVGCCYLVDNGAGANPRRVFGGVPDVGDLFVFLLEDGAGALWASSAPTVGQYTDFTGGARPSTPTPVAAAGAYLWSLTPSADDLVTGVSFRLDSPASAWPQYYSGDFSNRFAAAVPLGYQVDPAGTFIAHLRDYLTRTLPAAVAVINARRPAVLKSVPGPFVIASGARLLLGLERDGSITTVTLPVGVSVSADAVAAAISVPGITASADREGRVVLTAAVPTTTAPSLVVVARDDNAGVVTGGNAALGWAEGGEYVLRSPLRAPTWRGVTDGWPLAAPDMDAGFWVLLDDRRVVPVGGTARRRDSWNVTVTVYVLKPELGQDTHRSREAVTSAMAAVTEVLSSVEGQQLGRASVNDIQAVDVGAQAVSGKSFNFKEMPNALFDVATLTITGRVFQRAANS